MGVNGGAAPPSLEMDKQAQKGGGEGNTGENAQHVHAEEHFCPEKLTNGCSVPSSLRC